MAKLAVGSRCCQCPTCLAYFKGVAGFDGHRTGNWGQRVCLSPSQLLERGWRENDGYWIPPGKRFAA